LEWSELTEQAGMPNVYGLYIDRAVPGSDHGAYHGADVRYAFCSLDKSWRPYEDIDYRIANDMVDFLQLSQLTVFLRWRAWLNGNLCETETDSLCTLAMRHALCAMYRKNI